MNLYNIWASPSEMSWPFKNIDLFYDIQMFLYVPVCLAVYEGNIMECPNLDG